LQASNPRTGGRGNIRISAARGVSSGTAVPSRSPLPRSRLLSPLGPVVGATVAGANSPIPSAGRGGGRGRGAGRGGGRGVPAVAAAVANGDAEPSQRIQVSVTLTKDRSDINEDVYTLLYTRLLMDDRFVSIPLVCVFFITDILQEIRLICTYLRCLRFVIALERGTSEENLHLQAVMEFENLSTAASVTRYLKAILGWNTNQPAGINSTKSLL
jgi:hypothetical protein